MEVSGFTTLQINAWLYDVHRTCAEMADVYVAPAMPQHSSAVSSVHHFSGYSNMLCRPEATVSYSAESRATIAQ